ncbi:MAG: threonine--tRNA ligase [bacterium]|nr:threonine--tRNA ligase [bacterium]MDZ4285585.1 threonine--tRNA ligase [Candidatus Sungbacteria bacterium]
MNKSQDNSKIENIGHSLAHVLAMAVLKKFPKAQLGVGPVIENGFYYDIKLPRTLSDGELAEFEKTMRGLIAQKLDFKGEKITPQKARSLFKMQPFKLDLIKEFFKEKRQLTVYHTGEFTDLCRGGHVKNTSDINPEAFKLTKVAGAYWRGDEKNAQLTRIYGIAFETKEELAAHLAFLEEAKRRDHKRLGVELDLFTFSDLVGSGLPLWTPKGTLLRNILDSYVWRLRKAAGYEQVDIPHITKKDLYEVSGHWEKFKDELFQITTREGHVFAMKPMNCPHHTQIYNRKQFSYRELPQRYASTTKVYRDEQSGELSGLSRVRAITQDDAHVFARHSQVQEEILKIWDIITEFYGKAGFELAVRLSLSDPKEQKKYLGTPAIWKKAEAQLRAIIKDKGVKAYEGIGEAAFYGPKIDFMAKDSLGREWQVATIQLDMNLPERFDLSCINEKGERERIVMIHAAIMGSIERYLSILIEHFAGAFPLWLAPVQVSVLTLNETVAGYANGIYKDLLGRNIRAAIDDRNETIGKKIREAELQKIPYLLIIGGREVEAQKVAVRKRGKGDQGAMDIGTFMSQLEGEDI